MKWVQLWLMSGLAGAVQGTTVLARAVSTATTGGLGNPVLASVELGGAVFASILWWFVPLMAFAMILGVLGFLTLRIWKRRVPVAV